MSFCSGKQTHNQTYIGPHPSILQSISPLPVSTPRSASAASPLRILAPRTGVLPPLPAACDETATPKNTREPRADCSHRACAVAGQTFQQGMPPLNPHLSTCDNSPTHAPPSLLSRTVSWTGAPTSLDRSHCSHPRSCAIVDVAAGEEEGRATALLAPTALGKRGSRRAPHTCSKAGP